MQKKHHPNSFQYPILNAEYPIDLKVVYGLFIIGYHLFFSKISKQNLRIKYQTKSQEPKPK